MFERLRDRVKGVFGRMSEMVGGRSVYKSIFEVPGVPAFREFYDYGIFVWKYLWRGPYQAWHLVPAPTIQNPMAKREIFRLDTPKAISAELASLIWSEQCDVHVNQRDWQPAGDNDTDPLDDFVQSVLRDNNFFEKFQENIEQAVALGGAAVKGWHDVRHDADGNEIPGTGKIKLGYCRADQMVPISWNNAEVKEAVFVSRVAKKGFYYTRLEWHTVDGETYTIKNQLFKTEMTPENQAILGYECPLDELYPFIEPEVVINASEAFFSYFRTPIANNLDDDSPLGVSCYANAMSTLHALDICYDSFVSEFRLGKKRIIVPARAVRTVIDPATGQPARYFDATDEVYEALNFDDTESLKIQDNSVELRVEEHVKALNALLSVLCLQVGFSIGTFTFDRQTGLRTATEVISENSKTYKTVRSYQNIIQRAIEKIASDIVQLGALYEMTAPDGTPIRDLAAAGYDVAVHFDDSILQDKQSRLTDGVTLTGAGLMSKKKFMTDTLGYTPEEADAEIERIALENKVGLGTVDYNVFAGGAD